MLARGRTTTGEFVCSAIAGSQPPGLPYKHQGSASSPLYLATPSHPLTLGDWDRTSMPRSRTVRMPLRTAVFCTRRACSRCSSARASLVLLYVSSSPIRFDCAGRCGGPALRKAAVMNGHAVTVCVFLEPAGPPRTLRPHGFRHALTLQRARYRAWFSAFPDRPLPFPPRGPRLGAGSTSTPWLTSRTVLSEEWGGELVKEVSRLQVRSDGTHGAR